MLADIVVYRWKRRHNPKHIEGLEDRPHRPKHLWHPTCSVELIDAVLGLREEYPTWGEDRPVVLLRDKGYNCSASTAARILHKQKKRGVLKEPLRITSRQGKGRNNVLRPFLSMAPGCSGQMTHHQFRGESEKGGSE